MNKSVIEIEAELKRLQEELKIAKGSLKTVYAIGRQLNNVVAGHGDYYSEQQIRPLGMYGCDGFPPIFASRELAETYLSNMKYPQDYMVIELGFIE
jgi:hypothetical protein